MFEEAPEIDMLTTGKMIDIYDRLSKIYILPDFSSYCITRKYLSGVENKKYFALSKVEALKCKIKLSITKKQLYLLIKQNLDMELGFDLNNLPQKWWLQTVYFSVVKRELYMNFIQALDNQSA